MTLWKMRLLDEEVETIFCQIKDFCIALHLTLTYRTYYIADDNVMVLEILEIEDKSLSGYHGSFIFIFIRLQTPQSSFPPRTALTVGSLT